MARSLLAVNADAKTVKGNARGYLTGILYMSPADSGVNAIGEWDGIDVCPFSTPGCRDSCLNTAGRGIFTSVQAGRLRKRNEFRTNRTAFISDLAADIARLSRRAERLGMRPVVRLNGTSDIAWELLAPQLFAAFPQVTFYDYTKIPARMARYLAGKFPRNYRLTFSRSETNDAECAATLADNGTVAVVFATPRGARLPKFWGGHRVVDGDKSDLRFLDPRGVVVGLRAKGRAKEDRTGFVVRVGG